ncbi:MAG: hypothetical protein U9O94_03150 [Nanoarchaeota archaeon]|nr:hypothetical protein [Nanoarchaeota archaeon]
MKNTITGKEMEFISRFELRKKYFFTRDDIRKYFKSDNELGVYLHRLRKKGRIIKLNQSKYMLIPIKAVGNHWTEHPFIIIDEIMKGKDYCIVGKAAAHYWKLSDQIPFTYEVYNTKKHKDIKILNINIRFKRRRDKNFPKTITKKIYDHEFIIATKSEAKKWA